MPSLVDERVECIVCYKEHTSMFDYLRFIHKECFKEQKQNKETKEEIVKETLEKFEVEINILEQKVYVLGLSSKFKDHRIFSNDVYPFIFNLKKYVGVKK